MIPTQTSFYDRNARWITLAGFLLLPLTVWAALTTLATNSNEVKDWLPADYPETADFHWFQQHFPNDEFALVTWEGCTLDDSRLDEFAQIVKKMDASPGHRGEGRFPRVTTGRSAIVEMQESYDTLSREEAVEKLRGALVGPDGRQTCAIVSLTNEARRDVHPTLALLRQAAMEAGVSETDLKLGGTPVVNAEIDRESSRSLNRVVLLCCIVVSIIAWWLIRNLGLMVLILITGLYSAAISLTVLWLVGKSMNAMLITMIPMVYVAATSGSIHLCNYYVEAVNEAGLAGAADRAVHHAWLPLGLATATTSVGLLSICYTDLVLIQSFGIYSAIGVALSWLLLVFWLPAALAYWRPHQPSKVVVVADADDTGESTLPRFWQKLGRVVVSRHLWISGVCLAVFLACLPGIWWLKVSIDFMKEFRPHSRLIQTYVWLEEKLGPLMPMEVVLRIKNDSRMTLLQRIEFVERVQERFEKLPDTGGAVSVATYVPDDEGTGPVWLRTGVRNRRLEKDRPRLLETGFLAETPKEELWRISVRVVALREVNYAVLINQLRQELDEELQSSSDEARESIQATYTGVAPVLFRARKSLVDGLFWGIMTDLALIVVTVAVLMRHWSSGLLMTLTTLFPAFVVLGGIGWLGIEIDLGAIMAPCVALGVTIDDVIHFLLWFRTGIERGKSRADSVLLAWRACVRPMYQSWTLLGLGMGCLIISDFLPILQFGMIMVSMLTVGLIGNLLFLPSLLAGPLGKVIASRARARKEREVPDSALEAQATAT